MGVEKGNYWQRMSCFRQGCPPKRNKGPTGWITSLGPTRFKTHWVKLHSWGRDRGCNKLGIRFCCWHGVQHKWFCFGPVVCLKCVCAQLCLTFCNLNESSSLWTVAHEGLLSMKFSWQEYGSGLPFPSPGDLPDSGIEPRSPTLQADSLPAEPPGKPSLVKSACKPEYD